MPCYHHSRGVHQQVTPNRLYAAMFVHDRVHGRVVDMSWLDAVARADVYSALPLTSMFTCQRTSCCSGMIAVAIEGQDAVELLSASVRIGRICGRTKGVLSRLGAFAHPQAHTCCLAVGHTQTTCSAECIHAADRTCCVVVGVAGCQTAPFACRCNCQRAWALTAAAGCGPQGGR